jgi:hypothetical protein
MQLSCQLEFKKMNIKRIIISLALFLFAQISYADTGMLFNVNASENKLNIFSVPSNHFYPNAGIVVDTAGYSLASPGTECSPNSDGYCIFGVSDTAPAGITISGATGNVNIILCLNGLGPTSCQHIYNVPIVSSTPPPPAPQIPRFAYAVSAYNSSPAVSLCTLNPATGAIVSCADAGGEAFFAGIPIQGVVVNNAGTVAYLSNANGSATTPYAYQCQIDPIVHTFTSCTTTTVTTPAGYTPYEGLLGLNSTSTIIYLTDSTARILACPISSDTISGTCVDTGAPAISSNVSSVAINKADTIAYIGNFNNPSNTEVCAVNGSTFSNCVGKSGGNVNGVPFTFQSVAGVAFNNTEQIIYISDFDAQIIYGCSTTPSNATTFESCFVASSSVGASIYDVVINQANTVAYLTNYGTSVFTCPILANGTLSACTQTTLPSATTGLALLYESS